MAKCFDLVGYAEPCNAERRKPTGRALLFSAFLGNSGALRDKLTFTDNGLSITQVAAASDWPKAVTDYKSAGGNVFPVSIDAQNPFAITIQGNTDSGRSMYHKTVHCSLFDAQDGKAEEFIQGVLHSKMIGTLWRHDAGMSWSSWQSSTAVMCGHAMIYVLFIFLLTF